MTLAGHLRELRRRFIISVIAILVGSAFGWWAANFVFDGLQVPIVEAAKASGQPINLNFDVISGSFDLTLQIAVTIGVVITSPLWLYEIWAFITPGLKRKEKQYTFGFLGAAIPLFLIGCAVGWLVMPRLVEVLLSFQPGGSVANLTARYYYDFVLKLMIACGVGFVLPVFLVMLNFAGIISGKAILKGWRIAIIAIVTFTAATTPATDIMSMLALAVPMVLLYLLAVGISVLNDRRRARRQAEFLDSDLDSDLVSE